MEVLLDVGSVRRGQRAPFGVETNLTCFQLSGTSFRFCSYFITRRGTSSDIGNPAILGFRMAPGFGLSVKTGSDAARLAKPKTRAIPAVFAAFRRYM